MKNKCKDLLKFKDEKDFTLNAVIPWLETDPSYTGIKYTGGNSEFGRDVIFFKKEIGNRKVCNAIQVKDGDITGRQSNGIREIINQLVTAMNTPFLKENGEDVVVQGLWIITLGIIKDQAKISIKNSPELKGRHITFIEYKDILRDLKENLVNVIKVSGLIRIKSENGNYNFDFNKLVKRQLKIDFKIYCNIPQEDFFESSSEHYLDISFELPFDIFSKIHFNKLKIPSTFVIEKSYLRFYYSKIFTMEEIESLRKRFFSDADLKILEDVDGPYILFNPKSINKFQEDWIKDVNNLQILQKK